MDLEKILKKHSLWLADSSDPGGERANLSDADLRGANLEHANLRCADLSDANLRGANLSGANLRYADLIYANLSGANLSGANLRYADLSGANLSDADLPAFMLPPEEGDFIAWKVTENHVLKIRIPAQAKRTSSLVGRKCRAEYVEILEAFNKDGTPTEETKFSGWRAGAQASLGFIYTVGEIVHADKYDPDIRVECTHGIHFFMTRKEAEDWL